MIAAIAGFFVTLVAWVMFFFAVGTVYSMFRRRKPQKPFQGGE